ncbi:MAG: hypothetical protein M0Z66_15150 [Thermaerobacter sp.]|nr:hypothetical protein [Thermaerobacter sp.]
MSDEKYHLPGSSYSELVKVVRAYGTSSDPLSPDDIAKRTGMHPTAVSRNNGFLVEAGIIQSGKKKQITPSGRSLSMALEHNLVDEIASSWQEILRENDFISKLLSAVRIRNGMDHSTLLSHVAYTAGQSKTAVVVTGAGTVIDIMLAAHLLTDADGKYVVASEMPQPGPSASVEPLAVKHSVVGARLGTGLQEGLGLIVQVQVTCTVQELKDLGPALKSLMSSLRASSSNAE